MGAKATEFGPTIEPQVFQPEIPRQNLGLINAANHKDSPLFLVFDINIASVGGQITCFSDSGIPDFWIVTLIPSTGARAYVYSGPQNSGAPIRLGGGGEIKLPAFNEYLTIVCYGAPITGTVVAIRKYTDVAINGGNVT